MRQLKGIQIDKSTGIIEVLSGEMLPIWQEKLLQMDFMDSNGL